jgi:hypothetical protein
MNDNYFGLCPHCRKTDGCINVGNGHWFYCKDHSVKWFIGANLFSSWKLQTEAEQRQIYDQLGLGEFKELDLDSVYNPEVEMVGNGLDWIADVPAEMLEDWTTGGRATDEAP